MMVGPLAFALILHVIPFATLTLESTVLRAEMGIPPVSALPVLYLFL